MARPIWTGAVAFGLVNVPVALYTATEDKTVHFNQFQAGTADRIRYKRVNERTGREVELADIVRGHEVSKGDYVLVADEELEAIDPGRSRTIDIADFVDLDEIDQIYFQKTYYLAPQGEGAVRAYALLHRAMTAAGRPNGSLAAHPARVSRGAAKAGAAWPITGRTPEEGAT
jgi:DNA end-binding protein Ku